MLQRLFDQKILLKLTLFSLLWLMVPYTATDSYADVGSDILANESDQSSFSEPDHNEVGVQVYDSNAQSYQVFLPLVVSNKSTVPNPGQNQDIQPVLQAAIDKAEPGATLILPAGEFYLDGRVIINKPLTISGQGTDENGTKLYRRESVSDGTIEGSGWRYMFYLSCNSNTPMNITISNIHFKSKKPQFVSWGWGVIS